LARLYLKKCLEQFEKVSEAIYGRPFNLKAIEKEMQHFRNAREIKLADLELFRNIFKNSEHWWFDRYWVIPHNIDVEPHLKEHTFNFWQLSQKNEGSEYEQKFITNLLSAFRSIELVSIILRFIKPTSFGILSPPVERVLDVRRGSNAVETYLNYLNNLRSIRDNDDYEGIHHAAEADMALWVLHEKCFSSSAEGQTIREEYENDEFMLRLRTKNLVGPITHLPYTRLAQALETVRNDLAGLIACYVFEQNIQKLARENGISLRETNEGRQMVYKSMGQIIEDLYRKKIITVETRGKWNRLREIRNKVFHAKIDTPSSKEIQDLVKEILQMDQASG